MTIQFNTWLERVITILNIHKECLLDCNQIYRSNKMVTSNKNIIVTLLLSMIIYAPIINVCGAQSQYSFVNELRQDYDELVDVFYSSDENTNIKDEISQYGENSDVGWKAQEV